MQHTEIYALAQPIHKKIHSIIPNTVDNFKNLKYKNKPFVSQELALYHFIIKINLQNIMWTIIIILLVLWFLGLMTSYTLGGLLHILLVVAIILVIVRLIQGRNIL